MCSYVSHKIFQKGHFVLDSCARQNFRNFSIPLVLVTYSAAKLKMLFLFNCTIQKFLLKLFAV